jgi:hypothetical protein
MSMSSKRRVWALVATLILGVALTALAATWSSSDKWATWSNGGYTIRNDVWGSGAGPQTIWANSYQNWGVWANHPNTGGVKAYPHVAKGIWKNTNSIGYVGSYFNVSRPSSGAYCSAYDIWLNGSTYEIMLWMNKQGAVGPIGSQQASNQSVGGHTWNVYRGSNGSNQVFSFVRTSNTNSGNVDIKAVFNWLQNRGWFNNPQLGEIQFGFEITSSSGGMNFIVNGYSVWQG